MRCKKESRLTTLLNLDRKTLSIVSGAAAIFIFLLFNALFWFAASDRKISLLFSSLLLVLFAVAFLFWFCQNKKASNTPLLLAIVLTVSGLAYGAVFTPFSAPDEDFHYSASYVLSNFILGDGYQSQDPVPMRTDDALLYKNMSINLNDDGYRALTDAVSHPFVESNDSVLVNTNRGHTLEANPPQCKVASALGIVLGRLLHLNSYFTYYLGRLFNLIVYICLVVVAFKITPIGKSVIAAISLLPMSLHLAVSYSYDAFVIPMSLLLTALCLRSIKGEGHIAPSEWISIGVVGALLAPCKVIYALIVFMCMFIPKARFSSRLEEITIKLGCLLMCLLPIVAMRLGSIVTTTGAASSPQTSLSARGGDENDLGTYYTISDVLQNPTKFVLIIARTLDQFGYQYLQRMVGGTLGWFQEEIVAPDLMVVALTVVLLFSAFTSCDDNCTLNARCRISGCLLFCAGFLAVLAALLFSWTFNTDNVIYGVQGRYFLPFLPWMLLGLRSSRVHINCNTIPVLIGALSVLNYLNLVRIFSIALTL